MHFPVMSKEIINICQNLKVKKVLDCTFGAGGHTRALLERGIGVTAMDRDPSVQTIANSIQSKSFNFIQDKFSNCDQYLSSVDLVIADLGLSTMQINSHRGFSFMSDSPLHMSMDQEDSLINKINRMNRDEIAKVIKIYGEESNYKKIADNITKYKLRKKITTSGELREAIAMDKFPILARVFQSFRIFLNRELEELEDLVKKIPKISKNGALILSFHSLEDKIVKVFSKQYTYNGFLKPSQQEIDENINSRSAKLRFALNCDTLIKYSKKDNNISFF